jgi:hypothetical protein
MKLVVETSLYYDALSEKHKINWEELYIYSEDGNSGFLGKVSSSFKCGRVKVHNTKI